MEPMLDGKNLGHAPERDIDFLFVLTGELLHYFFSVMPVHALVEAARTFIANDTVQFCLGSTFLGHLDLRGRQQT